MRKKKKTIHTSEKGINTIPQNMQNATNIEKRIEKRKTLKSNNIATIQESTEDQHRNTTSSDIGSVSNSIKQMEKKRRTSDTSGKRSNVSTKSNVIQSVQDDSNFEKNRITSKSSNITPFQDSTEDQRLNTASPDESELANSLIATNKKQPGQKKKTLVSIKRPSNISTVSSIAQSQEGSYTSKQQTDNKKRSSKASNTSSISHATRSTEHSTTDSNKNERVSLVSATSTKVTTSPTNLYINHLAFVTQVLTNVLKDIEKQPSATKRASQGFDESNIEAAKAVASNISAGSKISKTSKVSKTSKISKSTNRSVASNLLEESTSSVWVGVSEVTVEETGFKVVSNIVVKTSDQMVQTEPSFEFEANEMDESFIDNAETTVIDFSDYNSTDLASYQEQTLEPTPNTLDTSFSENNNDNDSLMTDRRFIAIASLVDIIETSLEHLDQNNFYPRLSVHQRRSTGFNYDFKYFRDQDYGPETDARGPEEVSSEEAMKETVENGEEETANEDVLVDNAEETIEESVENEEERTADEDVHVDNVDETDKPSQHSQVSETASSSASGCFGLGILRGFGPWLSDQDDAHSAKQHKTSKLSRTQINKSGEFTLHQGEVLNEDSAYCMCNAKASMQAAEKCACQSGIQDQNCHNKNSNDGVCQIERALTDRISDIDYTLENSDAKHPQNCLYDIQSDLEQENKEDITTADIGEPLSAQETFMCQCDYGTMLQKPQDASYRCEPSSRTQIYINLHIAKNVSCSHQNNPRDNPLESSVHKSIEEDPIPQCCTCEDKAEAVHLQTCALRKLSQKSSRDQNERKARGRSKCTTFFKKLFNCNT